MLDATNTAAAEATQTMTKAQAEERRRLAEWLESRIAAGKKKPSAEVVTIVPMLATLLLERNDLNRGVSVRNAADLANDISEGRWEFNGESIVVSRDGDLLDGQHRLQQVQKTGKAIESVIVFGPRKEARLTIDSGKSRSVVDYLGMEGKKYCHVLGPAVNYTLQMRKFGVIGRSISRTDRGRLPTKTEVVAAADEIRGMATSVEFTYPAIKGLKNNAVMAFCHNVLWRKAGRESADFFIWKLICGEDLRQGDPILAARNRLLSLHSGYGPNDRAEIIFRAWNAHRNNERLTTIRITGGRLPKLEA